MLKHVMALSSIDCYSLVDYIDSPMIVTTKCSHKVTMAMMMPMMIMMMMMMMAVNVADESVYEVPSPMEMLVKYFRSY